MGQVVALTVANQQHELQVKEYRGQRVVTFRDVDEVHRRPEGTARKRFNDNRKHFIEGEDFFEVTQPSEIRTLGLERPQGGTPDRLILLTESGYLMLVKSFTDDLAWEVQRQLVNVYFRAKKVAQANPLRRAEIEARLRNAKTRQARLMKELAEGFRDQLAPEAVQLLVCGAAELLMGRTLLPKPQIDVTFTASEIAQELGISVQKLGRIATKHNLRRSEYGKWILDKAAHCDKQVKNFVYNEKGRLALIEAARNEDVVVALEGR